MMTKNSKNSYLVDPMTIKAELEQGKPLEKIYSELDPLDALELTDLPEVVKARIRKFSQMKADLEALGPENHISTYERSTKAHIENQKTPTKGKKSKRGKRRKGKNHA